MSDKIAPGELMDSGAIDTFINLAGDFIAATRAAMIDGGLEPSEALNYVVASTATQAIANWLGRQDNRIDLPIRMLAHATAVAVSGCGNPRAGAALFGSAYEDFLNHITRQLGAGATRQ